MRYAMRRLNIRLAIGGLIVVVVMAILALTTLGDNVAEAQETDCVTAGAVPAGNAGLAQDCEALLGSMDTLRGSAALNWSPSTSIKQWTGVRLGGSPQRVTIIKLQRQELDGSIPAGMGKVEKLVHLWLYSNSLTGPLPAELGDLTDLETLMLANNNLSGQIPEQLNNLTLSRLWLKNNDFTGCVPYNLTLVADNDLGAVNLPACDPPAPPDPPASAACVPSAAVPDDASAGLISDCEALMASKDTLRGSVPLNWGAGSSIDTWDGVYVIQLIGLRTAENRVLVLDLQDWGINGSIPARLDDLDELRGLWLQGNQLTGEIPPELANLDQLEELYLAGNSFTGCIPSALKRVWKNDLDDLGLPFCGDPIDPPGPPAPPDPGTEAPESFSDMVKRVRPAVVKVINGAPDDELFYYGSGFIFRTDDDGAAYILTNHHVVDEAEEIWVLVEDMTLLQADIEAVDTRRDLALLRICCGDFTTVEFMDSDLLNPGDEVITIGYGAAFFLPGNLPRIFKPGRIMKPGEATVTRGIISAFRYDHRRDAEVVQHDAPTNGGNSGGPLLSRDGRVVGVVTFRYADIPELGIVWEGLHFSVLETTVQERVRLWDLGPSAGFGPLSGVLSHDPDDGGFIEEFSPEFTATDDEFAIRATFTNPYAGTLQLWSYGFWFSKSGEADDKEMVFVVDSRKLWSVFMWDADGGSQPLHGGPLPQLRTGDGEKNELELYVDGQWGDLYVNGQRVSYHEPFGAAERVNLGGTHLQSHGGAVAVITGFYVGSERSGAQTGYEEFAGITYDHGR